MPLRLSSLSVILLLVASLGVSGCSGATGRRGVSGEGEAASESTTTPSSTATRAPVPGGTADDGSVVGTGPLTSGEAEALRRELETLERELNSIEMPDDGDFKAIEGELE